jgi:hypothetical protein
MEPDGGTGSLWILVLFGGRLGLQTLSFRRTLLIGIGIAKAYGFGLLLIA